MFEDKTEENYIVINSQKKIKFTIQVYGHKMKFFYNINFFLNFGSLDPAMAPMMRIVKKKWEKNMSEIFSHFGHFWLEWGSVRNGEI